MEKSLKKARKHLTPLDIALGLVLLWVVGFMVYRISAGLNYRWEWEVIPQYLLRFDEETGRWVTNILTQGFFTTVRLSLWGTCLAMIIGTVMGLFRISRRPLWRMVAGTYVEIIRNLPPLVLIFIFYYFISDQILSALGVEAFINACSTTTLSLFAFLFAPADLLTRFMSALITLSVFEGAYIAEIVRSGIQSIERGQWEASDAIGLSKCHRMLLVILPQAIRKILAPLAGQFISTIKDSAIVSVISIPELTFQGMELMSSTYLTFEVWITITLMYLLLTLGLSAAVSRLERYMNRIKI